MNLKIYNTLSKKKELFEPLNPNSVKMYVCGPTVYNFAHIGNARPAVIFDLLYRILKEIYPKVTYVRNITDVDDKINEAAKEINKPISVITKKYTDIYHQDMQNLNVLKPNHEPRVTENIQEIINMIKKIIKNKNAYIEDHHVLFDITSFENYGALSNRNKDEMLSGARVEVAEYKKHPGDFILWKPSSEKLPGWDSPWGRGRPGWHIECSAMSKKYLGTQFDIHAGGLDLIFPHHENEIAQSCCANKSDIMANYWLHNGYVTSDGEKMSKSLGNFATINNLLLNFRGEAIRYALMQAQYRAPLSFSKKSLEEATKSLSRLYRAVEGFEVNDGQDTQIIDNLCDDLNSPKALARLHYLADEANKGSKECAQKLKNSSNILGILCNSTDEWFKFGEINSNEAIENSTMTEKEINELIIKRKIAKENKEYKKADQIREQLLEKNIQLEDKPDRTVWRRL